MKKMLFLLSPCIALLASCVPGNRVVMDKEVLMDKIKGGWAGQTFGVTYGGPTEFKYKGEMIPDSVDIPWPDDGYLRNKMLKNKGLYDDIYMDLTFVKVIDKYGFRAPADSFAVAFANAGYMLWHGNQAARYNILNGVMPPKSGYWKNNPHANDIDFEIEADFAGLMAPGMPASALEICDTVGHTLSYGTGWYGGVYVATMYSLAFIMDDVKEVVTEALKAIPGEAEYHKCISDVIRWCSENPDWRDTWRLIEDNWADEISCPHGVKSPMNIDATLNSAYVVVGLLYGDGDMDKTIDISTRCGADSDCNPATAAGILGTIQGYSNIDEKWISPTKKAEDVEFAYTEMCLNDVYEMGMRHALDVILDGGGKVKKNKVIIKVQDVKTARYEESFEGLSFVKKEPLRENRNLKKPFEYQFTGSAVVCVGKLETGQNCPKGYIAQLEVTIDGKTEIVEHPSDQIRRRMDIYWNYDLGQGEHVLKMKWLNPIPEAEIKCNSIIVYRNK